MKTIVALVLINVLLIAGVAYAADSLLVESRGVRFDFYPHYVGGRAVWNGENPYTREVTEQIQMGMYGKLAPPEFDQQNMAYPAYSSIALAPIIVFPAETAIALWMAAQFVSVLWTPIIWIQILKWRPAPLLLGVLILGLLFVFRYSMDLFVLGQFSGTVLLAVSLGFLLLLQGYDIAAGLVFCLATIPPTMGAPLAVAILGAYLLKGRWKGLAAFAGGMLALTLVSFVLIGNWIPDYLDVLNAYQDYAQVVWAAGEFHFLPLTVLFVLALVGLSLWVLWRFIRADFIGRGMIYHAPTENNYPVDDGGRAVDLVVTALIVSLLLIPQTGEYYLVLLIPALIACLRRADQQEKMHLRWMVRASVFMVIVTPWLFPRGENVTVPGLLLPLQVLVTWGLVNVSPPTTSNQ